MMSSTFALQQGKASRQDKQGRSSENSPTPVMPPGSQHSSCPLCSTGLSSSPEDLHSHTSGLCVPHAHSPGVQPKGAGCSPLLLLLGAAQHSTAGRSGNANQHGPPLVFPGLRRDFSGLGFSFKPSSSAPPFVCRLADTSSSWCWDAVFVPIASACRLWERSTRGPFCTGGAKVSSRSMGFHRFRPQADRLCW